MKYGLILHNYGDRAQVFPGYNIGDVIQTIALENIYEHMGIERQQIAHIPLCDIHDYSGEYTLLPMCGMALGTGFVPFPISYRIIPVFISAHILTSELSSEAVDFLRTYQPIGCRDEHSLNIMRRYNILAYLSGCLTVTFPRRTTVPDKPKVLLIDTPASLEPHIPEQIREHSEYLSHLLPIPKRPMKDCEAQALYRESCDRLCYYRDHATLIVSSRLHALVPAIAMGIPVVAAFENISYRFSWLDKYLTLYSSDSFHTIDWRPQAIMFEDRKQRIKALICNEIRSAFEKYAPLYELSEFYEDREKAPYGNHFVERIRTMHTYMPETFRYLIWGCGLIGASVLQVMRSEFPNASLVAAVDNYVEGTWHGVPVIKPDMLDNHPGDFIILATYSGTEECYRKMEQLKRMEDQDFLYVATQNG